MGFRGVLFRSATRELSYQRVAPVGPRVQCNPNQRGGQLPRYVEIPMLWHDTAQQRRLQLSGPGRRPPTPAAKGSAMTKTLPTIPPIEPATQAFLDSLPDGPPIYPLSPTDARGVLSAVQASASPEIAPPDIEDRTLAVGPGGATNVRVVRPAGVRGTLPVIVYIHGGGWVLGDTTTPDRLVRELPAGAQAIPVS